MMRPKPPQLRRRALLTSLLTALLTAPAVAKESELSFVISQLPPGRANPLTSGGFPPLLIWGSMFDALTEIGENGTLQPSLATAWRAESLQRWIITLREGVVFSNGEPFNAEAAKGTLDFLMSDAGRPLSAFREVQSISTVSVRDAYTLDIATSTPDSMLPAKLAGVWMLPPQYLSEVGAETFARKPHGTGPFRAARIGIEVFELERAPQAWQPARLDRLVVRALPDPTSRVQALISGAADVAFDVGVEDIEAVEESGARVDYRRRASVEVWQFITERPSPLQDARVRLALNMAVDRDSIVKTLLRGRTRVATQVAAPGAFAFDPDLPAIPYDPARARQLLAEAGFPNGLDLAFQVFVEGPADSAIYLKVVEDLAKAGVRIKLIRATRQQNLDGVYNGKWLGSAFNMNWGSLPSLDPLAAMRYHSCFWSVPWICRRDLADLMVAADAEFDLDKRRTIVRDIIHRLHADPPGILLYDNLHPDGIGPRVAEYEAPFGFIRYHKLETTE